jgi:hypothetical protein
MPDLRFGPDRRGDVLMRRDVAAGGHRIADHLDRAPARQVEPVAGARVLASPTAPRFKIVFEVDRPASTLDTASEDLLEARARPGKVGRQVVHPGVFSVAQDEALIRVKHAKPVRHVGERGIEPLVLLPEGLLGLNPGRCVLIAEEPAAVFEGDMRNRENASVREPVEIGTGPPSAEALHPAPLRFLKRQAAIMSELCLCGDEVPHRHPCGDRTRLETDEFDHARVEQPDA